MIFAIAQKEDPCSHHKRRSDGGPGPDGIRLVAARPCKGNVHRGGKNVNARAKVAAALEESIHVEGIL